MRKLILVLFIILFAANDFHAQEKKLDVKAQVRVRSQVDGRDFNSDTDLFGFTELRTRLGVNLNPEEGYRGFIQIQDSRIFGTEPNTLTDTKNVDLHQAYIYVDNIFGIPVDSKIGRMEVVYGNQRLIGAVGWHNVGRTFDGGILKIKSEKVKVDLFGFQVNERLFTGDSLDNALYGAWGKITASKDHTIQPFLIYESQMKTDNLDRFTLGIQVNGKAGKFFHETEFAYQLGTINATTPDQDIKALMAAINIGYKFDGKLKPVLSAGIDYLSGDDALGDDEYKVFNTLYATNHKFYGYMDYFLNIPNHTFGLGLTDIHAKIGLTFSEKISGGLNLHFFKSSEDVVFRGGNTSSSFGTEADLTIKYKSSKSLMVQGGLSIFSPREIFEEARGEDTSLWAYFMTVFNF